MPRTRLSVFADRHILFHHRGTEDTGGSTARIAGFACVPVFHERTCRAAWPATASCKKDQPHGGRSIHCCDVNVRYALQGLRREFGREGIARASAETTLSGALHWQSGGRIGRSRNKNVCSRRVGGDCTPVSAGIQVLGARSSIVSGKNLGCTGTVELSHKGVSGSV